jgi:Predicted transcriptional regulators
MINGLAERLREQRTLNHLSQKQVAHLLDVSPSIVSNYEAGERTPSIEILMSLARLYHCSTDYLLGFEKEDNATIDVSMLKPQQALLLKQFLDSLRL